MKKLKIRGKLPNCPACGENKLDIKTYDYSRYGTCAPVKSLSEEIPSQTWSQHIEKNKKETIVDVRAPSQFNIIHFLNSKNIPYEDLVKMDKETIQK